MLHNYATRDRPDRDHEEGGRGRGEVGGESVAAARHDGERATERVEKKRLAEEKFFGGRPVRPSASGRTPSG